MANESFLHPGGWDSINLSQNNVILSICIAATILHFILWTQLVIQKTKFDVTVLFSFGYISTDILLLSCYFIQYSIRIRSWIPITRLFCYFEAYSMFFINLFEIYCLTALNVCRYWQIVRNRNIYTAHRRIIIASFILALVLISINMIIQDIFGWCVVPNVIGTSCGLTYTNIGVRIWNMTFILIIPISISFYMLCQAFRFLKKASDAQILLRRNHHRQLVINSLMFYSFWLTLWLPVMVVTYLDIYNMDESIQFIAVVLNTLEILADPVVSIFLDKRFSQAWQKSYQWLKGRAKYLMNDRVHPVI